MNFVQYRLNIQDYRMREQMRDQRANRSKKRESYAREARCWFLVQSALLGWFAGLASLIYYGNKV